MVPIRYERENSQEGPHCTSGKSNSTSPVWLPMFSCFSETAGTLQTPAVLLWPRQLHVQHCYLLLAGSGSCRCVCPALLSGCGLVSHMPTLPASVGYILL